MGIPSVERVLAQLLLQQRQILNSDQALSAQADHTSSHSCPEAGKTPSPLSTADQQQINATRYESAAEG
jgi:hypothetical protein